MDFIGKAVGQKRLVFASIIGGGVCQVMLFNSVLGGGKSCIAWRLGLRGGSANEAPFDEIRPLIYIV